MNKKIIISSIIILIISLVFLVFYFSNNNKIENKNKEVIKKIEVQTKKLSIDDKCIGCGKCARFDKEHFAMDYNSRKAIVISNKNLETTNLKNAISVCPVDAITLK